MIYEEGGGGHRSRALVAWGGGRHWPHPLAIRWWGIVTSMGGVVAAVPGRCLLWALGRCLWAPGHLVEGGWAVVHGRRLAVVVVRAGSSWALGRCAQILGCGLWAVGLVCGMSCLWVVGGCS